MLAFCTHTVTNNPDYTPACSCTIDWSFHQSASSPKPSSSTSDKHLLKTHDQRAGSRLLIDVRILLNVTHITNCKQSNKGHVSVEACHKGLVVSALFLFKNYLTNKKQWVIYNKGMSVEWSYLVLFLRPLLLLIYINYLCTVQAWAISI